MENPGETHDQYDKDYQDFEDQFYHLAGINLNFYKEKQMRRRIWTLLTRKGFSDYASYLNCLKKNPEELDFFLDYITINVTEFFRTADHWKFMETYALKDLFQSKEKIHAWSVACATGEEPYSLAISVKEAFPGKDIEILATDINEKVLYLAKLGNFSVQQMGTVPEPIRNKYFMRDADGFQISEEIRSKVHFQKMNLLQLDYPQNLDLILVRNVLIYFSEDAKNHLITGFQHSLCDGGYLFTGNTEQIINYKQYGYQKVSPFLYQKSRREKQ